MVKIKKLVIVILMFTFLIIGCSKEDEKANKVKDSLKFEDEKEEKVEKEVIGKFISDEAPEMDSDEGFTWYFYPEGQFLVMKEDVFEEEESPSTEEVKYGQYKFVDDNVFKVSYVGNYDLSENVFVLDNKDIVIQNVDEDDEILLENVQDENFENVLSKANLYGGRYQLYVDGVRKFHGAYIDVKKDGIVELYEAFKRIGSGKYYIFENLILIPSGNAFVFNELDQDLKTMRVPNTENVLRYQE